MRSLLSLAVALLGSHLAVGCSSTRSGPPPATDCGNGVCDPGECGTCSADCATDPSCVVARCGNGALEGNEECDEGRETASCDADCSFRSCGDGYANAVAAEACDLDDVGGLTCVSLGFVGGTLGCNATCEAFDTSACMASPSCGNGVVDPGEDCDDGGESAACDRNCTQAMCGDGTINVTAAEQCDDAGESPTCDADCTLALCGDGTANGTAAEQCDTGGESASCDANCTVATCGDATVNPSAGEQCDAGGESASCDTDCTVAACGDGSVNLTAGEACDAAGESAGCNANCTPAACGDGLVNLMALEQCDAAGESASCDADCTVVRCGDGVANGAAGEPCDTAGESAGCDADCTIPSCGDSVANGFAGELCDGVDLSGLSCTALGFTGGTLSCNASCDGFDTSRCTRPASCGNGIVDTGEQCDTAGESSSCDANCTLAICGDGTTNVQASEQCDTAGESAGCDADCTLATCGDGVSNTTAGEQCDAMGESPSCDLDCTLALCGDGTTNLAAGEECDTAGESASCDANCTAAYCGDGTRNVAAAEACDTAGETPECNANCALPVCGDGVVNEAAAEACDDGDLAPLDGCSASCAIETGFRCAGEPSVCSRIPDRGSYEQFLGTTDVFDLANATLTFEPRGADAYDVVYAAGLTALPDVPGSGVPSTPLSLADDTFAPYTLMGSGSFVFFGVPYTGIFVGSNGYVTLGAGDADYTESTTDHFRLPRIAALFDDLDPGAGGTLTVDQFADRVSISWVNVPAYTTTNSNTFQITLFTGGTVRVSYLAVAEIDGLVGLSAGDNRAFPPPESDYSTAVPVAPPPEGLAINEFLAADNVSDANCDGVTTGTDDEFVELVNVAGVPLDLAGVRVSDGVAVRHTFAPMILMPGAAVAVYGGGTPSCAGVRGLVASTGQLGLNDAGDTITVGDAAGATIATVGYAAATLNVASTLSPDLNDAIAGVGVGPFVRHDTAAGAGGRRYSPGLRVDGSGF